MLDTTVDMRIEVEKIKDKEIVLEEDIPAATWDLDSFDVKFVDNIHFDCAFVRVSNEIIVNVQAITHRNIICSRCLTQVTQSIKQKFELDYNVNSLGDYLEVDKDIREEMLLDFPMKVLCKEDCKGLCPECKADLNFEKCKCQMKQKIFKPKA